MKKHIIILFALGLFLSSCQDSFEKWGTVAYYPSFLWVNADTIPLKKTFEFEFSNDALNDNVSATIAFVDNNGKIIPTSEMIVYMGGEKLSKNTFTVNSKDTKKEFQFLFTPQAKSGKHQGRMKVVSSNLDRIDNLNLPEDGNLFHQWTIYFDIQMNPLAKVFMWIGILLVTFLVLWFIFLRPMMYPHFGAIKKTFLLSKDGMPIGSIVVHLNHKRIVYLADKKIKQSFLNRVFTGEIKTIINPYFTNPLKLTPARRGKVRAVGSIYSVEPNPMPKIGSATIYVSSEHIDDIQVV